MGKNKQNKSRNEPQQNVTISEPDFSVKSETLSAADKKLMAQKERKRKDEEEALKLKQKQIAEEKKKNTKTKSKQKNKQTPKKCEPDVDINVKDVNDECEVNEGFEIDGENVESLQEMSLKEQETSNFLEKMDPSLTLTPDENNWRKRENISKPNYSSPPSYYNRRSTGNYNNYSYNLNDGKNDKAFQDFLKRSAGKSNGKVREIKGDLFDAPVDYSLAHCVAEDFNMGAGIAKEFKARFKGLSELYNQNASTGGLAFLTHKTRFIYYLVTKKYSRGKPSLYTLWQSLIKMHEHIVANNVCKLAIPQIGCGLDRLDWNEVKSTLEYVFKDVDIDIVVYILEFNKQRSRLQLFKRSYNFDDSLELDSPRAKKQKLDLKRKYCKNPVSHPPVLDISCSPSKKSTKSDSEIKSKREHKHKHKKHKKHKSHKKHSKKSKKHKHKSSR